MQDAFWEWDDEKAELNATKHDVTFKEARSVFSDPNRVEAWDEEHSETEDRFFAIGFSPKARLLYVVYTIRGERTRILHAHLAEREEEELYAEQNEI